MMFSSKRCIACAIGASCIASEEMIPGIQRVVSDAGPSDESEFGDPIGWSFRAYLRSTKGGSSHVHRFWWVIPFITRVSLPTCDLWDEPPSMFLGYGSGDIPRKSLVLQNSVRPFSSVALSWFLRQLTKFLGVGHSTCRDPSWKNPRSFFYRSTISIASHFRNHSG